MFDVLVIGGGVIGASVLRELSKYDLKICLLEKESDVCMGASRANSGVVHAGFDAAEGTLKAKFNVEGNLMMEGICKELGVKYKKNGSLVVAFSDEDLNTLQSLKARGEANGVGELEIISAEELRELEPNLSDEAVGALYAKTGGIVCPYELTISLIGNAMDNGAVLYTDFEAVSAKKEKGAFTVTASDGRQVQGKIVVNCAGLYSGKVAEFFGDDSIKIGARKGEYILLDRECAGFVTRTLFFTPTKLGKGVLVLPTVDNNILLGPTAEEMDIPDTETTQEGLNWVIEKAKKMCKNIPFYNTITSFAGIRAYSDRHDFIVEKSPKVEGLINCAGIESPGLTSAPAIAKYVVNGLIGALLPLNKNVEFNPYRRPDYFFKNLTDEEKNQIIKKDPTYGRIICRCEQITEGEIICACTENPRATTVDGAKRRTRAGMGRCQGGFCQPYVAEIIAKCNNLPLTEVTKSGKKSNLLQGVSK